MEGGMTKLRLQGKMRLLREACGEDCEMYLRHESNHERGERGGVWWIFGRFSASESLDQMSPKYDSKRQLAGWLDGAAFMLQVCLEV